MKKGGLGAMPQYVKLAVIVTMAIFLQVPLARAMDSDQLNIFNEGIDYFDVNSGDMGVGGCITNLNGSGNKQQAFNYLVGRGLPDVSAAGIVGNLELESNVDPTTEQTPGSWQDMGTDNNEEHGVGIAQWDGARRPAMITYAESHGLTIQDLENGASNDLAVELDFLWYELTNSYQGTYAKMKHETAVTQATIDFAAGYEEGQIAITNPSAVDMKQRIYDAQQILTQYGGTAPSGGQGGQTCGSGGSIVQIALSQVGTSEGNTVNAGASCKYQGSACPPGEEWCADFVSWVYNQAGVPFTGGEDGGWRIASAAAVASWFQQNGTWIPNTHKVLAPSDPNAPQPGDVVYYPDNGGHVNIVVSYDGKTVMTVGGNESNSVAEIPYDVFGTAGGWGRLK